MGLHIPLHTCYYVIVASATFTKFTCVNCALLLINNCLVVVWYPQARPLSFLFSLLQNICRPQVALSL